MLIRIQMKKTLICIAVLMIAAALISCGRKAEKFTFRAAITEIQNGSMLVTPVDGSDELRSSDSFRVKIENMPSSPEPEVGDIVEITYDGGIQETYPAGLDHVFSIVVVEKAAKTEEASPGSTTTIQSCIPEKSILWFQDDEGARKLMEDMNDGKIPQECSVLYDEMGARPEVTVTDAETITDLYNRLALMSVGEKSEMSITDSYHHISFTLQDGTTVGWNFEGKDLLNMGTENYDVKDEGNLWFAVRQLQEKAMGNEEVTDY